MIQFFSVSRRYTARRVALDRVSFEIPRGQFVFLRGPSGAGKTTLLKLIYCDEVPDEGRILVNGRNVAALPKGKIPYLRRTIGVVFQDFHLIQRKTIFENVSYLPRILGANAREQRRLAYRTLSQVGLAHRMSSFPAELSGGEQQRVAIARAIINEPEILLADEPTGNLDPSLSREIVQLFVDINRRGTTVLVATHDPTIIPRSGNRVLVLEHGRLVRDLILRGADEPRGLRGDRQVPRVDDTLPLGRNP
ncbi:MAG: cell division ATP-binding protein FtsE [Thermoanaerobaculia bacterium]|nr:cell division ATP-binding protein FtsE [Thermoanaerobaculia bacterium]